MNLFITMLSAFVGLSCNAVSNDDGIDQKKFDEKRLELDNYDTTNK